MFVFSEHGKAELLLRQRPRATAIWLSSIGYRRAERVIVHSQHMAQVVEESCRVPRSKIAVVYYGIDLREFSPSEHPQRMEPGSTDGSKYRVGFVGRIYNQQKGVDYIPLVARLLRERGCDDIEFLIAGDGPDRPEMELLCRENGVEHQVRFIGWQTEVPAFLQTLDALVVPSRFEPFGLVTIEALAMGVRVVAFNIGGIPEAANGCSDVTLIPLGDVRAFAEAILDLRRRFGHSRSPTSRTFVQQRFARARMAREIEAVYEAVNGRRAR